MKTTLSSKNIKDIYELSPMQEGMFYHALLDQTSSAHFEQIAYDFYGELDPQIILSALEKVLVRHDVLRTVFNYEKGGRPLQVVLKECEPVFSYEDISTLNSEAKVAHITGFKERDIKRSFDLTKNLMIRLAVFKLEATTYRFVWSFHHILMDGWCMGIAAAEFYETYYSIIENRLPRLPEVKPYRKYIEWLDQQDKAASKKYWHEYLRGYDELTAIPRTLVPDEQDYSPGLLHFVLSKDTTAGLKKLATLHGVTFNIVVQALWGIMLSKYTGRKEVLYGFIVSGRPAEIEGIETMIGLFINTIPIRISYDQDVEFASLLGIIQRGFLAGEKHNYLPLADIQNESELKQHLFDHILVFENFPVATDFSAAENGAGTLNLKDLEAFIQTNYQFNVVLGPDEELSVKIAYNKNVYDSAFVEQIRHHFTNLAEQVLSDVHVKVEALSLLSLAGKEELLSKFNPEKIAYPAHETMHHLFETTVARNPDAIAVSFGEISLTYAALNEKANQLAHHLRNEYGIKPDDIVALMMDRSERMIIGILAILKAGAAYLPIDPYYPEERIRFILEDAKVGLLLTDSIFMHHLAFYKNHFLALDIQLSGLTESTDSPLPVNTSNDLAYIIYTSGSTGQPKGVMIEHHGNINMALDQISRFEVTAADHVLQFASLSFDASVYEIFMAFYAGATLVLIEKDTIKDAEQFVSYIREQQVSIVTLPPAYLSVLDREKLSFLRVIITAGDDANVEQATYCSQFSDYYNAYGPTECSVCVSVFKVSTTDATRKKLPIGRPLNNTAIYILNDNLQILPPGVEGEICISGAGLARGYLNRSELTQTKFVDNPFDPGTKLYKTADLGRWLPDGNIEFIRRKDTQVKIRGYRIETGEIEHVMREHMAVEDAYVYVSENKGEEKSLTAVFTARNENAFTLKQLLKLKSEKSTWLEHQYELPNGMIIFHKNKGETNLIYKEIFEEQTYFKHGISIADGDVVFDIGANIGMFSLFAGMARKNVSIYAFEPLQPIYAFLLANAALYDIDITAFNFGISSKNETADFSYYPYNTAISGRYGNERAERELVKSYMQNESAGSNIMLSEFEMEEILEERMKAEMHEGQLKRLSDVINEIGITRIDLLKIDVEKSELDVVNGIDSSDWEIIRQVVIEVHDIDDNVKSIQQILISEGFDVFMEQEDALSDTNIFNIYGIKERSVTAEDITLTFNDNGNWINARSLVEDVTEFCNRKLPDYMVPANFKLLDRIPLTINGKVDIKALKSLQDLAEEHKEVLLPTNEIESQLLGIWQDVLERETISIRDNFFEIGGHSLKATQLVSRIHRDMKSRLELKELFANPTIEDLASCLMTTKKSVFEGIKPVANEEYYDVSNAQKRLWILYELDDQGTAYNMCIAVRLKGTLHRTPLEKALVSLVARHESLRTNFVTISGVLKQKVHKAAATAFNLDYIDLRNEADPETAVKEYIRAENDIVFNLKKDPLFRARLLQLGEDDHVFILSQHHIISDAWSLRVIIKELNILYSAYCKGNEDPIPPLNIQYKDYTDWHNKILNDQSAGSHKEYWNTQFKGELPVLQLPVEMTRPVIRSFKGKNILFSLDKQVSRSLHELGQKYGSSLFMTLIATMKALFYRYTGQEDIIIGSLIAGRDHADLEDQIGFYVNTLALRTTFNAGESFVELLKKVKEVTLSAHEHQVYPFDRLVDDLNVTRNISRSPLFDVMIGFENPMIERENFELFQGVKMEVYTTDVNTSKFDMIIDFENTAEGIGGVVGYNTDIFTEKFINRLINHYKNLVTSITKDAYLPLHQFDYLEAAEKQQLIDTTVINYPRDKTIVDLFEEQAYRMPDNTALVFEGTQYSYRELDERSNQLARHLRESGVKEDTIVPLCIDRSLMMIVGIMGILKAGAAYLPIDPTYPEERIRYMIEDSAAGIIVTDSGNEALCSAEGLNMIRLDADWKTIAALPHERLSINLAPHHLAYVIYTSGSTGKPKGVMVEHGNVVRLFKTEQPLYDFNDKDVWTLFHSFCFDFSVWEIFGALLYGGRLVIVPRDVARDPVLYASLLSKEKVTVLNQTPNAFYVLSNEMIRSDKPSSIRYVIFGGEALNPARLADWHKRYPDCRLMNMYGITETTVHVTCKEIGEAEIRSGVSNIGKAIPTLYCYLLDGYQQLVSVGVIGEIYVGGPGLARGYLNRETLTQEKFIPDPFKEGGRLYKTGDLGKWLADGSIEYLGRIDDQVKIRGYRIELGEIEDNLFKHKDIAACVVTALEINGEKQLIAYFQPERKIELWPAGTGYDIHDKEQVLLPDLSCASLGTGTTKIAVVSLPVNEFEYSFGEKGALRAKEMFDKADRLYDLRVCLSGLNAQHIVSNEVLPVDAGDIYLEIKQESEIEGLAVWLHVNEEQVTVPGKHALLPIYLPIFSKKEKVQTGDYIKAKIIKTVAANGAPADIVLKGTLVKKGNLIVDFEYDSAAAVTKYQGNDFYKKLFSNGDIRSLQKVSVEMLRSHLGKVLPAYMMPAIFIEMPNFPLTSNGKINRKALPYPSEWTHPDHSNDYAAPVSEMEKQLAKIWQEVLGLERVSINDNFFEIGGNSLNATVIISHIYTITGLEVGLVQLFNYPALKDFAKAIEQDDTEDHLLMNLNRRLEGKRDLFFIPPIVGTSALFKNIAACLQDEINCYGIQCRGFDKDVDFDQSLEQMATRFISQIMKVQQSGEYLILGYSFGGAVAYEITRQLEITGAKVRLVILDHMVDTTLFATLTEEDIHHGFDNGIGKRMADFIDLSQSGRIKKLMAQNYANLQRYRVEGQVIADILALEAKDNILRANMSSWKKHTKGLFKRIFLDGGHDEIIMDKNLPAFFAALNEFIGLPVQPMQLSMKIKRVISRMWVVPKLFFWRATYWLNTEISM